MKKTLSFLFCFVSLLTFSQNDGIDVITESLSYENNTRGYGGKIVIKYTFRNCFGDVNILMSRYKDEYTNDYYFYKGKKYSPNDLGLDKFTFVYDGTVDVDGKIMRKGSPNIFMTNFLMTNLISDFGGCLNSTFKFNDFLTDTDKKEIVVDETALNRFILSDLKVSIYLPFTVDNKIEKLIEEKFHPDGEHPNKDREKEVENYTNKVEVTGDLSDKYFVANSDDMAYLGANHNNNTASISSTGYIVPAQDILGMGVIKMKKNQYTDFDASLSLKVKFINDKPVITTKTRWDFRSIEWAFQDISSDNQLENKYPDLYSAWKTIKPEYMVIETTILLTSLDIVNVSSWAKNEKVRLQILIENLENSGEYAETPYQAITYQQLVANSAEFEKSCNKDPSYKSIINSMRKGELYPQNPEYPRQPTGPSKIYTDYKTSSSTPNLQYYMPRMMGVLNEIKTSPFYLKEIKWPWQRIEDIVNEYHRREFEKKLAEQRKEAENNVATFWDTPEPTLEKEIVEIKKQVVDFSNYFTQVSHYDLSQLREEKDLDDLLNLNLNVSISKHGTITDIEGNVYKTYKFGDQEWMIEDLMSTKLSNGDKIIEHNDEDPYLESSFIKNKREDQSIRLEYSLKVMKENEVCPVGWTIPSEVDFQKLNTFLNLDQVKYIELEASDTANIDMSSLRLVYPSYQSFWVDSPIFYGKAYKQQAPKGGGLWIDFSHDAYHSGTVIKRSSLSRPYFTYAEDQSFHTKHTFAHIRCIKK